MYCRICFCCLVVAGLLLGGCDDGPDLSTGWTRPPLSGPPIETDGLLTANRQTIYYVHTDTAYPTNNGVYSVYAANPVPRKVFAGRDVVHPSGTPDASVVAFIDNQKLWYYSDVADTFAFSGIDTPLEYAFFISNTTLIGYQGHQIFEISLGSDSISLYRSGTGPSPHTYNTFLWLRDEGAFEKSIIITNYITGADSVLYTFDILSQVTSMSHFPSSDRLLMVTGGGPYSIATVDLTTQVRTTLVTSQDNTGVFASYNEIVYTHDNGELWRCDYDGSDKREFRGDDGETNSPPPPDHVVR